MAQFASRFLVAGCYTRRHWPRKVRQALLYFLYLLYLLYLLYSSTSFTSSTSPITF